MTTAELNNIVKRLVRLEKAVFGEGEGNQRSRAKSGKGFGGPSGGVRLLINQGFFKSRKGLAEVREGLTQQGYHYSTQVIHTALNRLANPGGPLVALRQDGKKVYAKRK